MSDSIDNALNRKRQEIQSKNRTIESRRKAGLDPETGEVPSSEGQESKAKAWYGKANGIADENNLSPEDKKILLDCRSEGEYKAKLRIFGIKDAE